MPERVERGALTEAVYYILLSVYEPLHGYGIMQKVTLFSRARVNLAPGTLYGAITTMLEKNWIQLHDEGSSGRKKEYIITDLGKEVVEAEIERLEELLHNGKEISGGRQI